MLRTSEVARRLDTTAAHVRELARADLLPAVRVGRHWRFDEEAIETWIAEGGSALPGDWRRDPAAAT